EVGGHPNVPWPRVGDDIRRRQASNVAGRIVARQHYNARSHGRISGHLGSQSRRSGPLDQFLREPHGDSPYLGSTQLFQDVQAAELGINSTRSWSPGLEPPGVVVQHQFSRVEAKLVPVAKPSGRTGLECPGELGSHVEKGNSRSTEEPLEPA